MDKVNLLFFKLVMHRSTGPWPWCFHWFLVNIENFPQNPPHQRRTVFSTWKVFPNTFPVVPTCQFISANVLLTHPSSIILTHSFYTFSPTNPQHIVLHLHLTPTHQKVFPINNYTLGIEWLGKIPSPYLSHTSPISFNLYAYTHSLFHSSHPLSLTLSKRVRCWRLSDVFERSGFKNRIGERELRQRDMFFSIRVLKIKIVINYNNNNNEVWWDCKFPGI